MVTKVKEDYWSGKKAFGIWGILSGAATAGAVKTVADIVQPNNPNNLFWALAGGVTVGTLIGALTASGVLNVRFLSPRKKVIQI